MLYKTSSHIILFRYSETPPYEDILLPSDSSVPIALESYRFQGSFFQQFFSTCVFFHTPISFPGFRIRLFSKAKTP